MTSVGVYMSMNSVGKPFHEEVSSCLKVEKREYHIYIYIYVCVCYIVCYVIYSLNS